MYRHLRTHYVQIDSSRYFRLNNISLISLGSYS